jgi:hypothetical protein
MNDRRQTPEEALRERPAPNDLASAAYTLNGRAVVMRIARADDGYALLLDDGGLTVRRILFRDPAELSVILPSKADKSERGYEEARSELIRRFGERVA